ncbi:zinc metalloproteinase nas-6-like [Hydractinia symbiolongicarpus]|uniref:zinc metalloproteinase nas-6-like n=1 Tax=Hydractinia symbiolongicarpus TaxID=13093 RepID=UPI00254EE3CA|nr:zinc metalloproteinase nas-6-like [Hydractinia symbiolongicarpus]
MFNVEDHAKLIHSAIKEFEKTTCLSFVKKRKWHQHYIVFKSGHICSSNIGRQYWSKTGQDVTLGRHCMQKRKCSIRDHVKTIRKDSYGFNNLKEYSLLLTISTGKKKGVIVHEIMHALGFWHEHTRSDRDKYVEIMWENIAQGEEDDFERQDGFHTDNMDFKYDYHSVLHYDNYAFSTNRRQTIKAILKDRLKLGNTMGLSPGDVLKINKLYNCQGNCC